MLWFLLACATHQPAVVTPDPAPPPPTVVLVSLDGFRRSYLEQYPTPHLDRIAAAGVVSEGLIPPFPSKTFPSHYTAVTGLYPAHHGIVANRFSDPAFERTYTLTDRSTVQDGRWYGGEPIWATANKAGLRTATCFWPGSEAEIAGERPDEWRAFDADFGHTERIDQLLSWLGRPPETRPQLMTVYLGQPDKAGHHHGPDSPEVAAAVAEVDAQVGRLVDGIDALGLSSQVDLLVVADHGMAATSSERVVLLDDAIDPTAHEIRSWSPVTMIDPAPGQQDRVMAALATLPHTTCGPPAGLDKALHLEDSPRLGALLCVADDGWTISSQAREARKGGPWSGGTHGYDPRNPSMHGLFVAQGPHIAQGQRVPAVENVHLYSLLAHILGVPPAPNDGDLGPMLPVLAQPPKVGVSPSPP